MVVLLPHMIFNMPVATPFCQPRTIDRAPPVKTHELNHKQRVKYVFRVC